MSELGKTSSNANKKLILTVDLDDNQISEFGSSSTVRSITNERIETHTTRQIHRYGNEKNESLITDKVSKTFLKNSTNIQQIDDKNEIALTNKEITNPQSDKIIIPRNVQLQEIQQKTQNNQSSKPIEENTLVTIKHCGLLQATFKSQVKIMPLSMAVISAHHSNIQSSNKQTKSNNFDYQTNIDQLNSTSYKQQSMSSRLDDNLSTNSSITYNIEINENVRKLSNKITKSVGVNASEINLPSVKDKIILPNMSKIKEKCELVESGTLVKRPINKGTGVRVIRHDNGIQRSEHGVSADFNEYENLSNRGSVELVYAQPNHLRRDMMETHHYENPLLAPNGESRSVNFLCVDSYDAPSNNTNDDNDDESKTSVVKNQFGEMNDFLESVVLRLYDWCVIPGAALRGVIYMTVKDTLLLKELKVMVEMITKTRSANEKHDMEKHLPISLVVVTENDALDRREPPLKFSHDLPEFAQSAIKEVNLNDVCFIPYCGPIQFCKGTHAIPFAFPIEPEAHPSILLKGKVGVFGEVEIMHRYIIYASILISHRNVPEPTTVTSEQLSFKVQSCGPTIRELPSKGYVPSIMQTFTLGNRQILVQVERTTLQASDEIHVYIFTDNHSGLKSAEAYLLRIFHIPGLKVSEDKALYKLKKYPRNVYVDAESGKVEFTQGLPLPFSAEAEKECVEMMSHSEYLPSQYRNFRYSTESLSEQMSTADSRRSVLNSSTNQLTRGTRRAGCHLILGVPVNSPPQSCLEELKITYYLRVIINTKNKMVAYSLPISVVETCIKDYKIRYLKDTGNLHDPDFLKLKKDKQCNVS